ncbi:hypothetical protein JM93_01297 [Roseibium hamelinense]|uniref:Retropepsin-like aspartic endopeptidase domain-containing protein n=3 Tax=Roseibium hamelinense TaxID=150831 RepID=A0A562T9H4_9HYPH|nr:RimK/LysX family protein [Roseibium hamelinense]MTI45316.1 ATP-dependent zinc protease [Roseibium hamelinense]TWI90317.1 hypothetical protein JM93_01297 [Roseibium hamelinense]
MISDKKGSSKSPFEMVGWREVVSLPELGIQDMRAKIDTGARTSAIHAEDQVTFEKDGTNWVRFRVPASRYHKSLFAEVPILDQRDIKNTSGVPERRIVIRTLMVLGRHHWHIDLSLANREKMGFDMILGRTAIRGRRIVVHPGRSFLASVSPEKKTRRVQQSETDTKAREPTGSSRQRSGT